MFRLLVRNAKQVVTICTNNERVLKGEAMQNVAVVEAKQGEGVSVVIDGQGNIACIDEDHVVQEKYADCQFESEINAAGMCVLPGK